MTNTIGEEMKFPTFCERSDVNLLAKSKLVQLSIYGLKSSICSAMTGAV